MMPVVQSIGVDRSSGIASQQKLPTHTGDCAPLTGRRPVATTCVLLVGPVDATRSDLGRALQEDGYSLAVAPDGGSSLELVFEASRHDLIVLSERDGENAGVGLLETLREWSVRAPVIVVLGHDRVSDRIAALDAGADAVMERPVAIEELLARARALLRRPAPARESVLRLADLMLDPVTREVRRAEKRIGLTPKEFALLEYLLRNAGRVVTRCMILERVWGLGFDPESNRVDVYIAYLRRKIEMDGRVRLLHSVRSVGYVLAVDPPG